MLYVCISVLLVVRNDEMWFASCRPSRQLLVSKTTRQLGARLTPVAYALHLAPATAQNADARLLFLRRVVPLLMRR